MNKGQFRRPAGIIDVVVIGAGHSGLAISHALSARNIEHVVLERGEVANAWRTERWDSLRLLTPNWLTRLPGQAYNGDDPDGYMAAHDVAGFISGYAKWIAAPVLNGVTVTGVETAGDGYRVVTDRGDWLSRAVILATGAFNVPLVPPMAEGVPNTVRQVTPNAYRNPSELDEGGVLVVGASATGLQLADEIHRSGRPVTLAVGEHVRMPRTYRGRDIQWWMLAAGLLDQRIEDVDDPPRARRVPSPQLVGTPERKTLDLNALSRDGVRIAGRLAGIRDGRALFSGSLGNVCALADLKMNRLLASIDEWAAASDVASDAGPIERFEATGIPATPTLDADLGDEIRSIVWATGFRPDFSWLDVPVFDTRGRLRHNGGVIDRAGLYILGLPFLRRRKSSFIHGAEDDVRDLSQHLAAYLDASSLRRTASAAR